MNVVVLNDKRPERELIVRILQQACCTVEAFAQPGPAIESIRSASPQVLVLSWPNTGGPDLVRLLRGVDGSHQMYLLAILDPTPGGRDISHPLAAGVHDFLRRPLIDAELVARVQAPVRLFNWAKSVTKPIAFDFSSATNLTRLAMWKTMGEIVGTDLAQMIGDDGPIRPGLPKTFPPDPRGATIPMSLAADARP